jgi:putative transposase
MTTPAGPTGCEREGMEETLTLTRLGISGNLKRRLGSTNPCESMLEIVRRTQRNVKAGPRGNGAPLDRRRHAQSRKQFRKIIGYRDLATLVIAIERELDRRRTLHVPIGEVAVVGTV